MEHTACKLLLVKGHFEGKPRIPQLSKTKWHLVMNYDENVKMAAMTGYEMLKALYLYVSAMAELRN